MNEETKTTMGAAPHQKRAVIKRLRPRKDPLTQGTIYQEDEKNASSERHSEETNIQGPEVENGSRQQNSGLQGAQWDEIPAPGPCAPALRKIGPTGAYNDRSNHLAPINISRTSAAPLIPGDYQSQTIPWMIKTLTGAFLDRMRSGTVHASASKNRDLIKDRIVRRHKEWKNVIHRMIELGKCAEEEMNRTYVHHSPSQSLIEKLLPDDDPAEMNSRLTEKEKETIRRKRQSEIVKDVTHHEAFQSENHTPIKRAIAYTMFDMIISYVMIEHTLPLEIEIREFELNFPSYRRFLGEILRKIERAKCERQRLMEDLPTNQIHLGRLTIRCKALSSDLRDDKSKKTPDERASDAEELHQVASEMKKCLQIKIELENRDLQLIDLISQCRTAIIQTPSDLRIGDGISPTPIVMTKYFCLPDYYPEMDSALYSVLSGHQNH